MITSGTIEVNKDVDLTNNTVGNYAAVDIKGKLSGYGVNAGVYFKPTNELSIGLSYRSQMKMMSKGATVDFTNIPSQLKDSVPPNGSGAKLTIPLPQVITLGFGIN